MRPRTRHFDLECPGAPSHWWALTGATHLHSTMHNAHMMNTLSAVASKNKKQTAKVREEGHIKVTHIFPQTRNSYRYTCAGTGATASEPSLLPMHLSTYPPTTSPEMSFMWQFGPLRIPFAADRKHCWSAKGWMPTAAPRCRKKQRKVSDTQAGRSASPSDSGAGTGTNAGPRNSW